MPRDNRKGAPNHPRTTQHLFVYGTLRSGFQNQFARLPAEQKTWLGRARIEGRLQRFESPSLSVFLPIIDKNGDCGK